MTAQWRWYVQLCLINAFVLLGLAYMREISVADDVSRANFEIRYAGLCGVAVIVAIKVILKTPHLVVLRC